MTTADYLAYDPPPPSGIRMMPMLEFMMPMLLIAAIGSVVVCALSFEYSYIRRISWKTYTRSRSNLLRVAGTTALAALMAWAASTVAEYGADYLLASPYLYGFLLGSSLFLIVLRKTAAHIGGHSHADPKSLVDASSAGADASHGLRPDLDPSNGNPL